MSPLTNNTLFTRWHLSFSALSPIHFVGYSGSAWRGMLGHALKATACLNHQQDDCATCGLSTHCNYIQIFEPQNTMESDINGFRDLPRPYVLHLPWHETLELNTGDALAIECSLFNQAISSSSLVMQAFAQAAQRGLGQGRLALQNITPVEINTQSPLVPDQPVTIHLHTPLRLKHYGKLVKPEDFDLSILVSSLLMRLQWLMPNLPYDMDKAMQQAYATSITNSNLHWVDWQRYSSRQQTYLNMGGIMGELTLAEPAMHYPDLWPLLWLGQFTHVGKGAVMGLGDYSITPSY